MASVLAIKRLAGVPFAEGAMANAVTVLINHDKSVVTSRLHTTSQLLSNPVFVYIVFFGIVQ
jgi:hypothetical protein